MASRKRSTDEEINLDEMFDVLEQEYANLERRRLSFDLVPPGWCSVERDAPVTPPKTKISISLDEDLLAWFRSLGRGYQPRMNAVLRAYMLVVISKEIGRKTGAG
jgi:uncharacterized protein (DUF4415 family)